LQAGATCRAQRVITAGQLAGNFTANNSQTGNSDVLNGFFICHKEIHKGQRKRSEKKSQQKMQKNWLFAKCIF
jgi:hypothetical protein